MSDNLIDLKNSLRLFPSHDLIKVRGHVPQKYSCRGCGASIWENPENLNAKCAFSVDRDSQLDRPCLSKGL